VTALARRFARRCTVVIPVLNQLPYSRQCVDSLVAGGTPADAILVIDNGSSDETPAWLAAHPAIRSLRNDVNLGCGGAWTQGALLAESEWVVLLNNDIVAPGGAIESLLASAERHGLGVASPALVEGTLDYDLVAHAERFRAAMAGTIRPGWFHGVCFAVRWPVFEAIGFPDTDRQLGGREDVEFLIRCQRNGVAVGTVGDSLLHHFGSITQKAIKLETGTKEIGDRHYFYRRIGMGWAARHRFRRERKALARRWAADERARHGFTMHMIRERESWRDAEYL
jgi:GT2 family glycosyltransferase